SNCGVPAQVQGGDGNAFAECLGGDGKRVPPIAEPYSPTYGSTAIPPDQYGDMGLLERFGREGYLRKAVVLPCKARVLLRPQLLHDGNGFIRDRTWFCTDCPSPLTPAGLLPHPPPKVTSHHSARPGSQRFWQGGAGCGTGARAPRCPSPPAGYTLPRSSGASVVHNRASSRCG